jgi:ribosomal protein L11 methyltransferase
MDYIELNCTIDPFDANIAEILTAELSEMGYESFVEQESGILAYIRADQFDEQVPGTLTVAKNPGFKITFAQNRIKEENWNETWEKNYFEPIIIANQCVVRSSFHPVFPEHKYQITIDPKMAFGTGHHDTTSLIIKEILEMDFTGKSVGDLGCGTGILAILSAMRGAQDITAVDIDEWSYKSTLENIELNNCKHIKTLLGDVSLVENQKFDIIFANINKNVLLVEMFHYAMCMKKGSVLILSGFYNSDFADIDKAASNQGMMLVKQNVSNNWMMLKYLKLNN